MVLEQILDVLVWAFSALALTAKVMQQVASVWINIVYIKPELKHPNYIVPRVFLDNQVGVDETLKYLFLVLGLLFEALL